MAEEKTSADPSPTDPAARPPRDSQIGIARGGRTESGVPETVLQDLKKAVAASPQERFSGHGGTSGGATATKEAEPQDSGVIGEQDIEFLLNQA